MKRIPLILGFPDYAAEARALADALQAPSAIVETHCFPDGEHLVRVPESLPDRVVFCRSLDHPNDKLIELALAADAAREQGARCLDLVAPYLCYMRQDTAFHPGEAVSQRVVGRWLADRFQAVITVDPHLHRTRSLAEAVPARRAVALSAAQPAGAFLARRLEDPLLLGPDEESAQWVEAMAGTGGFEHDTARKVRYSDREVDIVLPERDFRERQVVLVDDMASTGRTLATAAARLFEAGAAQVHALVTHALFVDDAVKRLQQAGIHSLWSTNSIPHPSNVIPLAGLLAGAL